ncbi:MAG: acetoacetate decarboxylase family protein [Synergistaceae bacterium]|nr:acetoacetate decarboxylase family protein [Synergistaceae bacterium]
MIERPYKVQDGYNNPIQASLFRSPFVPYKCTNMRSLAVWAETDPDLIKKYLEPTPFEYVSNVFNISISDFMNADGFMGFYDCSFCIPVKYKDIYGAYTMFEYESEDFAIWAGRELWGYPKVYAEMNLVEGVDKVVATATKNGIEFVHLELDRRDLKDFTEPDVQMHPHLQLQVVPNCDGPGIYLKRVMSRDTSPDYKGRVCLKGDAALTLRYDGRNPLDEFSSAKIIGAVYSCGEFNSTVENGWAKVVDILIKPTL